MASCCIFNGNREINEETRSERLLSELQRCFKSIDREECGYIPSDKLAEALQLINYNSCKFSGESNPLLDILNNPVNLARLRGHLQIDGEIILWTSFWISVSRLLTGASLDDLISVESASPSRSNKDVIVLGNDADDNRGTSRVRSDSEVARQLQAELDANPNYNFNDFNPASPSPSSQSINGFNATTGKSALDLNFDNLLFGDPKNVVQNQHEEARKRSDSDLARELQEQFNNEMDVDAVDFFDNNNNDNNNNNAGLPTSATSPTPPKENKGSNMLLMDDTKESETRPIMHRSDR